jgi:NTP pyrophosphatase (non-canonical NTP hydrolase)
MRLKLERTAKRFERPKTLTEFQQMFFHIYGKADQKYSDRDLLFRLMEEIASTMELARKDYRDAFKIQLATIFSWYISVANRFGINLQEILWFKYPGACTYCTREANCTCAVEHPQVKNKEEIVRRMRRERNGREPISLSEHQALHKRLYGWQNARILPIQVAAHLAEEMGEVCGAYRRGNFEEFRDELADIASWIFALATRLELAGEPEEFDLARLVWERYPYECWKCHSDVCNCEEPKRDKKRKNKWPARKALGKI